MVCMPLTNGNWQERWEGMCTITSSATEAELGVAAGSQAQQSETGRAEAELWRAGGGFRRNEVNLTRSGKFRIIAELPVRGAREETESCS